MSLGVRAANRSEAALLARLHDVCFDEKWKEEAISGLLDAPGTFAFVAGKDSDWQSFALARVAADEAEILSLGTLPIARRMGLAQALVVAVAKEAVARGAEKIFLEVSASNAAALALYAGLGFAEVGVRPRYYPNLDGPAADALTLAAALPLAHRTRL